MMEKREYKRLGSIHQNSEPVFKKKINYFYSKYQADTCDVNRIGEDSYCVDQMMHSDSEKNSQTLNGNASETSPVFSDTEFRGIFGRKSDHVIDTSTELAVIKNSLDKLHANCVSKAEFAEFMVKFNALSNMVSSLIPHEEAASESLLSPEFSLRTRAISTSPSIGAAQIKQFCSAVHDKTDNPLMLPQSVILRVESCGSKRGICKEILRYLHPEPNYFDHRTVSGRSRNRPSDDNQSTIDESFEPIPALTVKFCSAAVNRVKPLDRSRYNESVLKEEQEKYDGDTMSHISRAVIDIRRDDRKTKAK